MGLRGVALIARKGARRRYLCLLAPFSYADGLGSAASEMGVSALRQGLTRAIGELLPCRLKEAGEDGGEPVVTGWTRSSAHGHEACASPWRCRGCETSASNEMLQEGNHHA